MNIGVIVKDVGTSQLGFLALNQCGLLSRAEHDVCIFTQELDVPCITPSVAIMNVSEIFGFRGLIVSTSIESTLMAVNSLADNKVVFYVWDLEWMRGKNNFLHNLEAYRHPKVELICRSMEHAKEIRNYANVEVRKVIPNLNLLAILDSMNQDEQ